MRKSTIFCILILITSYSLIAQTIVFDAEIRPRTEFRNGFKALSPDDLDPAFFTEQRTRLNTFYTSDKVNFKVSIQDVRIWGATAQIYKEDPSLTNIYEAWGQYYFTPELSFKMGRMPIVYHNERFFGALGWAAQGRSHDAALLIYEQKKTGVKLDVGLAFNQRSLDPSEPKKLTSTFYEGTDNYKNMQYLFLSKKLDNTDITTLIHNDGKQIQSDSTTAYRQTLGVTIDQNINDDIKVGGEVYYQMGKDENDVDVSAFLISAYATLSTDMTPITLAIDYASGTKNGSETNNSWNPLYGTNHKFYGWMDYFYVGNSHGNVGLVDLRMFTKFKTGDRSNFQARGHYFLSAEEVVDESDLSQTYGNGLGAEIDLLMTWKLDDVVSVNLGYSQLFATESMQVLKGGDHTSLNNWAWLQVTFKPRLLEWENKN